LSSLLLVGPNRIGESPDEVDLPGPSIDAATANRDPSRRRSRTTLAAPPRRSRGCASGHETGTPQTHRRPTSSCLAKTKTASPFRERPSQAFRSSSRATAEREDFDARTTYPSDQVHM